MLLSPRWRRVGVVAVVAATGVTLTGCASRAGRPLASAGATGCERFLFAAQTALATTDSAGVPPAHAPAAAMHEYHACLATQDSAEVAGNGSGTAP